MSIRTGSLAPFIALLCIASVAIVAMSLQPWKNTSANAIATSDGPSQRRTDVAPIALPAAMPAASGDRAAPISAVPIARGESAQSAFDPAEARARIDANIVALERRFAAEPLDLAWASREERALQAFFAADTLASQGLPVPDRLQIVCRSATCRISARFFDPIEAETTTQRLAMHVASRLPYGAVMPYPLADGRIQVEAWYSATRIAL